MRAALLLSLAAALAVTWPVVTHPTTTILCGYVHPDCLGNHWLLAWIADQLATGGSLLHNDRYYWPIGDSPWLAGNGSDGFLYAPWHWLLGWPLASTVHELLVLTLNGVAAWTLCRAAGVAPLAALPAAPTGAILVYAIFELGAGRFSQVSVCWLLFFLAAWLRFLAAPDARRALAAAALLALTSFFYWYYGFFGVLAGAILLAWRRPPLPRLALFAAASLAMVAPLLWLFLRYWADIPGTAESAFPHPESVNDSAWPSIPFLQAGGRHAGRALPFSTVALALAGAVLVRDRLTVALLAVGGLFAALMAGVLIPNGPYEWVYGLAGPLRRFWWPYRHIVVVNAVLIVLAARGGERLLRKPVLHWLLALSIPVQLQLQGAPWHVLFSKTTAPSPFYVEVSSLPGTLLLEPPLSPKVASSQTPIAYQLMHRKRLITGHALWVDRVRPEGWDAFVAGNSFLSALQSMETSGAGTLAFAAADLQALLDAGLGPVVVNQEFFPIALDGLPEAYTRVSEQLFGPPVAKGTRALAWDATRWTGATTATYEPWAWPPKLRPGGPTLAIQAIKPPSLGFEMAPASTVPPRK